MPELPDTAQLAQARADRLVLHVRHAIQRNHDLVAFGSFVALLHDELFDARARCTELVMQQ
jgi:hypothetical protein